MEKTAKSRVSEFPDPSHAAAVSTRWEDREHQEEAREDSHAGRCLALAGNVTHCLREKTNTARDVYEEKLLERRLFRVNINIIFFFSK